MTPRTPFRVFGARIAGKRAAELCELCALEGPVCPGACAHCPARRWDDAGCEWSFASYPHSLVVHASLASLRRLEDSLQSTRTGIAELQKRIQDDQVQQAHEKARMEKQVLPASLSPSCALQSRFPGTAVPVLLRIAHCAWAYCVPTEMRVVLQMAEVQRSHAKAAGSGSQAVQENQRLKAALLQRQQRDADIKRKLAETATAMQDALKNSEESTKLLQELVPGIDSLHKQLMVELGR